MSLSQEQGKHVHFPAKPDKFEFDSEVATIFDSMAQRSIPMYEEVHRLHVSMFADKFAPGITVADLGASTGNLFKTIETMLGAAWHTLGMHAYAIDPSQAMMGELQKRYAGVTTVVSSLADAPELSQPADFMACLYVLQFMKGHERKASIDWIKRNLSASGVLVMAQKDSAHWKYATRFQEAYFGFRRANGYTQHEIDAKTAALKNSMWTVTPEELWSELNARGLSYIETTRWVQFSSGIVTHR